jgi:hypothetical protein
LPAFVSNSSDYQRVIQIESSGGFYFHEAKEKTQGPLEWTKLNKRKRKFGAREMPYLLDQL